MDKTETNDATLKVAYDEQVELAVGQSLQVSKTESAFTFTKVVTDSRCPTGLDCFQAGEAVLLITLPNGSAQTVRIPADGRRKTTFGIPNGLVTVTAFNPYPVAQKKAVPADYRLVVKVSKTVSM